MVRALVAVSILMAASPAFADRDLCAPDAKKHGAAVDLDLKDADIHDVLRLIADVAHINLVVSDEVTGKVTLHLRHVAWDLAACAVAATHHLSIRVDENILIVKPTAKSAP